MVGNVATAAVKGLHVAAALASGRFILRSYEILAIYAPFNPIFLLLQQKESVWKVNVVLNVLVKNKNRK